MGAAVVVVDMQNDFCSPFGMVGRRGVDIAPIQALVEPIRRVLSSARSAGVPVVYLKMGYHSDLSDTGGPDAPNWFKVHAPAGVGETIVLADGTTSRILIRDTWNTEIIDELAPEPGDLAMYKHRFSGFYETDLDQALRALGVRTLIFTGCTTSVCVESTLRDAFFRDYRCVLVEDCVAERERSSHDATLQLVKRLFGSVMQSGEVIEAFESASMATATPDRSIVAARCDESFGRPRATCPAGLVSGTPRVTTVVLPAAVTRWAAQPSARCVPS